MLRAVLALFLTVLLGSACWATPYWINWEGDDFPENQGWTRIWGNWDGMYQGTGAARTLNNGILTYDSLYDSGVYDFNRIERPGQIDPGPGETFVMEWRLKVDAVVGYPFLGDPGLSLTSDEAWMVGFEFAEDHIVSLTENYLSIPFAPGVFHSYRLTSTTMQTYELYIDNTWIRHGTFEHLIPPASSVGWGDDVQGEASVHEWDYFRAGVVPEAQTLFMAWVTIAACCVGRWR